MQTPAEEIEAIVLQLPRDQRAYLAERLISSLDEDAEVEEAWAAEIRRRVAEIRSSVVETIDASEVLEELKDLYR